MKSIHKKIIPIALLLLTVAAISLAVYLKQVMDYKRAVNAISIEELDLSKIPDGIYYGEYDVGFIYAKVEVVLNDGKIAKITILEHKNDRGASAEVIVENIVAQQRLDVDAVSGATNSSAILKRAVMDALLGDK